MAERERAADIPVLIDRFRGVMDQFNRRGEESYALSVSAGCARWEDGYPTLDAFIADADERMYEDKRRRKQNHGPSGIGVWPLTPNGGGTPSASIKPVRAGQVRLPRHPYDRK